MPSFLALLRSRVTVVWVILVLAAVLSYSLGSRTEQHARNGVAVAVIVLAFVKVRLVGRYFMELRDAPLPLRALFDGYCLVVCGVVLGMFLAA
jgi:Prokaryotic Cytochrome C oxidase subunit IV